MGLDATTTVLVWAPDRLVALDKLDREIATV